MFMHDFNTGAKSIDFRSAHPDLGDLLLRIGKGGMPEQMLTKTYLYIPVSAGEVSVRSQGKIVTSNAPCAVVMLPYEDLRLSVSGSPEDIYSFQHLFANHQGNMAGIGGRVEDHTDILKEHRFFIYPQSSRRFMAGGQERESGWYVHSLKVQPAREMDLGGVSDVLWADGEVRSNEFIHRHRRSLEPLIVLSGEATVLHYHGQTPHSFVQKKGVLTLPDYNEWHGILAVSKDYGHLCGNFPSMFHDPSDRVILKTSGIDYTVQRYVADFGIPSPKAPQLIVPSVLSARL